MGGFAVTSHLPPPPQIRLDGVEEVLWHHDAGTEGRQDQAPAPDPAPQGPVWARMRLGRSVPLTQALGMASLLRAAWMSQARWADDALPEELLGRDGSGQLLAMQHRHVHLLPEARAGDAAFESFLVWCPMGLSEGSVAALGMLQKLYGPGVEDLPLRLVALGEGAVADSLLVGPATQWVSLTPYLLRRFPKLTKSGNPKLDAAGRQVDGPESQLRQDLLALGLPWPDDLSPQGEARDWAPFQRQRPGEGLHVALSKGHGWAMRWDAPVQGPLALGGHRHYGMGLWVPQA